MIVHISDYFSLTKNNFNSAARIFFFFLATKIPERRTRETQKSLICPPTSSAWLFHRSLERLQQTQRYTENRNFTHKNFFFLFFLLFSPKETDASPLHFPRFSAWCSLTDVKHNACLWTTEVIVGVCVKHAEMFPQQFTWENSVHLSRGGSAWSRYMIRAERWRLWKMSQSILTDDEFHSLCCALTPPPHPPIPAPSWSHPWPRGSPAFPLGAAGSTFSSVHSGKPQQWSGGFILDPDKNKPDLQKKSTGFLKNGWFILKGVRTWSFKLPVIFRSGNTFWLNEDLCMNFPNFSKYLLK